MLKIDNMQIDDTFKVYAEAVLEQQIDEIKATVAAARSANPMSGDEFREILSQHSTAVKQAYSRVHANYHRMFDDDRCPETARNSSHDPLAASARQAGECLFCLAERRFTETMTDIIEYAGNDRNPMTADEIDALARKHGVPYIQ